MQKTIYYHDTDAGGVVYYGRYLNYLEEARTELLRQQGVSVPQLVKEGYVFAVRECHLEYKSPARYGDVIELKASIKKMTGVQIVFDQEVVDAHDQRLLVKAEVLLVCLGRDFKPTAMPEEVRLKLSNK